MSGLLPSWLGKPVSAAAKADVDMSNSANSDSTVLIEHQL